MVKYFAISFLSRLKIYHIYINAKYTLLNFYVRIFCQIEYFCFRYLNYKPSKIDFFIQRDSFGESIYDYVNALTNIKKFLDDLEKKNNLDQVNVYLIGNNINKVLNEWFNCNLDIFLKKKSKKDHNIFSNKATYNLYKNKKINIFYLQKRNLLLKKYLYTSSRAGILGSYANRFDLSKNYKFLLSNEDFISIEEISKKNLPDNFLTKLKKISSKKIVVFYDYDIKNRKNRKHLSNNENQLKHDLYLRYFDNSIIKPIISDLLAKGFNVVRLGRSLEKFTINHHKNFFDFAFDYSNSNYIDSLDFLIPYNSEFCLTLGCGAHECSRLYGLPLFFVGYHRYDNLCNLENSMLIPKKYYDVNSGDLIPISKLINRNIIPYNKKYWDSRNIMIKSPSYTDIKESLNEFLLYIREIKRNDFSILKNKKIRLFQNFYLGINKNSKRYKNSKTRYKKDFSVIISEYELNKYGKLYLE